MVFVFAIAAACSYAAASVLQQRSAAVVPGEHSLRLGLLARLTRNPTWLAGVVVDGLGFVFEAAALAVGSLALVQPLLVLGLPLALLAAARLQHHGLGRRDWAAVAAVTVGVGIFIGVTLPSAGRSFASLDRWVVAAIAATGLVAVALLAARRVPEWKATMFAGATGVLHAFSAALTKSAATLVRSHPLGALTHWEPYAVAFVGTASMVLVQSAFQAGDLSASLPTLTLVPPTVAVVLGMYLFGEHVTASPTGIILCLLAAATATGGVYGLGRHAEKTPPEAPPETALQPSSGSR